MQKSTHGRGFRIKNVRVEEIEILDSDEEDQERQDQEQQPLDLVRVTQGAALGTATQIE